MLQKWHVKVGAYCHYLWDKPDMHHRPPKLVRKSKRSLGNWNPGFESQAALAPFMEIRSIIHFNSMAWGSDQIFTPHQWSLGLYEQIDHQTGSSYLGQREIYWWWSQKCPPIHHVQYHAPVRPIKRLSSSSTFWNGHYVLSPTGWPHSMNKILCWLLAHNIWVIVPSSQTEITQTRLWY